MILDRIDMGLRYRCLHPLFEEAFDFLLKTDFNSWQDGKYDLENGIRAIIEVKDGKGRSAGRLETHERAIDIQAVISGVDLIGWRGRASCHQVLEAYDSDRDIAFWGEQPGTWFDLPVNHFAIFHPDDAHAPLCCEQKVRKVILKIPVHATL